MQIRRHDRSHLVELRDGSAWRIWPGDIPKTLQWRPTTEIDVADIDDAICSHALIDRSNGSWVRVISFTAQWPAAAVRRCLRHGSARLRASALVTSIPCWISVRDFDDALSSWCYRIRRRVIAAALQPDVHAPESCIPATSGGFSAFCHGAHSAFGLRANTEAC